MAGAIFVLGSTTAGQQGPVAAWTSTAGWAAAARRVLGAAWIVTPDGVVSVDEARRRGSSPDLSSPSSSWRRRVPGPAKTALKDARQWRRARALRVGGPGPWDGAEVSFVWQRHELFQTAGLDLARRLRVPSVLFVPATLVWESAQWGVRRPGWRSALERLGEQPALRAADVVACGTELVAEQARRLGVADRHILVTPTGVDVDLFSGGPDREPVRRDLGLDGRFVVGWVGSFRRFHALEQAVDAVTGLEDVTLLLVGDGPERPRLERYARERGVAVTFTGTVAHLDLPGYLAAMDVALVLARPGDPFHYSPLKLAEYLAAGLAVVAPNVPQLANRLTDTVDSILVAPGDTDDAAAAIRRLQAEPRERARIASAARATARARWSWDHQIRSILDVLG